MKKMAMFFAFGLMTLAMCGGQSFAADQQMGQQGTTGSQQGTNQDSMQRVNKLDIGENGSFAVSNRSDQFGGSGSSNSQSDMVIISYIAAYDQGDSKSIDKSPGFKDNTSENNEGRLLARDEGDHYASDMGKGDRYASDNGEGDLYANESGDHYANRGDHYANDMGKGDHFAREGRGDHGDRYASGRGDHDGSFA